MTVRRATAAALIAAAAATLCGLSVAGSLRVADGQSGSSYDAQIAEGQALYEAGCARCHGAQLQGEQHAPALTGNDFRTRWNSKTARAFYGRVISTMPLDSPGSLSASEAI